MHLAQCVARDAYESDINANITCSNTPNLKTAINIMVALSIQTRSNVLNCFKIAVKYL